MNLVIRAALVAAFLLPAAAMADAPATYKLSSGLVEEIFQKLAREPYADVAAIIAKLQDEVKHQPEDKHSAIVPLPQSPSKEP